MSMRKKRAAKKATIRHREAAILGMQEDLAKACGILDYYANPEQWPPLPWHPGIASPDPDRARAFLKTQAWDD